MGSGDLALHFVELQVTHGGYDALGWIPVANIGLSDTAHAFSPAGKENESSRRVERVGRRTDRSSKIPAAPKNVPDGPASSPQGCGVRARSAAAALYWGRCAAEIR